MPADNVETQQTLKTALATLTRVLDEVNWEKISKGDPDASLYFYEDFLAVYDNKLRKPTGSKPASRRMRNLAARQTVTARSTNSTPAWATTSASTSAWIWAYLEQNCFPSP